MNCNAAFGASLQAIKLWKIADKSAVLWGDEVTYTYVVQNRTAVDLHDVTVIDDNGTPDDPGDDFVAGHVDDLARGERAVFTVTKKLTPVCAEDVDGGELYPGSLEVEVLPSGDVKFVYTQSRSIVDNTYGANAVGYTSPHRFDHLLRSDNAEFSLTNGDGDEVMYLIVDYLHEFDTSVYPSGYGTAGVLGGDGAIPLGDPAHVLYVTTSLTENLNQSPAYYGYTVDSPPEPDTNWDYFSRYTVIVDAAAFGDSGFGSVDVVRQHNSPAKDDRESVDPEPCERCITNTAVVTAVTSAGGVFEASATAQVCVFLGEGLADVSGTVYLDTDGSGAPYDSSTDDLLSNVGVQLQRPDGTVLGTALADAAINEDGAYIGNYLFEHVPAGDYTVVAPVTASTPLGTFYANTAVTRSITVADTDIRDADFGYTATNTGPFFIRPVSVLGYAFFDANQNGRFDDFEMPFERIRIELTGNAAGVTDTAGRVNFGPQSPGSYTIRVTDGGPYRALDYWNCTTALSQVFGITSTSPAVIERYFGFYPNASSIKGAIESGAVIGDNCSAEFWRRNVAWAIDGVVSGVDVSKTDLSTCLAAVENMGPCDVPFDLGSDPLQAALWHLDPALSGTGADAELLRQLLAAELNWVSGRRSSVLSIEAALLWYGEQVGSDGSVGDAGFVAALLEAFNSLGGCGDQTTTVDGAATDTGRNVPGHGNSGEKGNNGKHKGQGKQKDRDR